MEYGHGGDVYRNRNVELDFSINVNPLGMPNFVWEAAMKSIALSTRYPDSTCGALRARMSELTGIPGEMMIFGNGAAELIFRLVQTLCPKKAAIPAPSFMEYETALKACGTEVSFFYLKESESFFLNISEYLEFLKKERPDMIFLCTPANPTGAMMRKADLLKILDYCKRAGIVAVIDECFIEFLNEGKTDGCIREFLAWKEGMPENGGRYFSSGHLRRHTRWRDCGSAMDSARIRDLSSGWKKTGSRGAYRSRPRKLGWRLFRMSGSRS